MKDKPVKVLRKPRLLNGEPKLKGNAGRPLGSSSKIKTGEFLDTFKKLSGKDLVRQMVENYINAVKSGDKTIILGYDARFLSNFYAKEITAQLQEANGSPITIQFTSTDNDS